MKEQTALYSAMTQLQSLFLHSVFSRTLHSTWEVSQHLKFVFKP